MRQKTHIRKRLEFFKNHKGEYTLKDFKSGKVLQLNERERDYLLAQIFYEIASENYKDPHELETDDVICPSCYNLGYLEVETDTNDMEIQACETCDHFGIVQRAGSDDINEAARYLAEKEGILK